jgi:hypothetical protein
MPSMSYCMYENTAGEMAQCLNNLEDNLDNDQFLEKMSEYERDGIMELMRLAKLFTRHSSFLNRLYYDKHLE